MQVRSKSFSPPRRRRSRRARGGTSGSRLLSIASSRRASGKGSSSLERINSEHLKIKLNHHFDGKLALVRDDQRPIQMRGFTLTVIGPFREDLDVLRKKWNQWVKANKRKIEDLKRELRRESQGLATTEIESLHEPLRAAAEGLGKRSDVTPPNLASLMLLAEADGRTVLLTGDGHATDIVKGLRQAGRLDAQGRMHFDVMKVQHHGAKANITSAFAREITADCLRLLRRRRARQPRA